MDIMTLREIIGQYFTGYPIFTNVNAIQLKVKEHNLSELQVDHILRSLCRNTEFFEDIHATQYGLLNLFIYAVDAMYVGEENWDNKRAVITGRYKTLINLQDFFTINIQ